MEAPSHGSAMFYNDSKTILQRTIELSEDVGKYATSEGVSVEEFYDVERTVNCIKENNFTTVNVLNFSELCCGSFALPFLKKVDSIAISR